MITAGRSLVEDEQTLAHKHSEEMKMNKELGAKLTADEVLSGLDGHKAEQLWAKAEEMIRAV